MSDARCDQCRWWRRRYSPARDRNAPPQPTQSGLCMHSPPTAAGDNGRGKWPVVLDKEWCGQWQERPEG